MHAKGGQDFYYEIWRGGKLLRLLAEFKQALCGHQANCFKS